MKTEAAQAADEDRRLIAQIAIGDERALDTLYARYRPRLRGYLWRLLDGDGGLVEEALQDIFLAVWQTAARYRGEAKVATWVFQIAHNIAISARRRGERQPDQAPLLAADRPDRPDAPAQSDPYGEAVIARLSVRDALGKLSEKHREVLDLFFRQGFFPDEIAAILGIPPGTVRSRLSYARKALRDELNDRQQPYGSASSQPRTGEER